jgi:hypothetical protein
MVKADIMRFWLRYGPFTSTFTYVRALADFTHEPFLLTNLSPAKKLAI